MAKFSMNKAAAAAEQAKREALIESRYGKIADGIAKAAKDAVQLQLVAAANAAQPLEGAHKAVNALWAGYTEVLDAVRADCEGKSPTEMEAICALAVGLVESRVGELPKRSTPAQYAGKFRSLARYFPSKDYWEKTLAAAEKTAPIATKDAKELSFANATAALSVLKKADKDENILMLTNLAGSLAEKIKLAINGKAGSKKESREAIKPVAADVMHKLLSDFNAQVAEATRKAQLAISEMADTDEDDADTDSGVQAAEPRETDEAQARTGTEG